MALETVKITVVDDQLVPEPVDGIVVRVFNEAGVLITQAESGVLTPGVITLDLPGSLDGTNYELRFFKIGAALPPQRIRIFSPAAGSSTGTNNFRCVAEVFRLEPASDVRMCRISGFVANAVKRGRRGVVLTVIPKFNSFIYEASVVTSGRFMVYADRDGFVSFDLFRHAMYTITIEGQEASTRDVQVPNRPALSLTSLMFPVVQRIDFVPAPSVDQAYAIPLHGVVTLVPTVVASDYRVLEGTATEDVGYSIDDPSIASVYLLGDRLEIRGHAPGTTVLRVSRLDDSVVSLPDLGIVGGAVTLVVA